MATASAPTEPTITIPAHKRETCGADRNGRICRLRAGHGTDHLGYGNCKFHGGLTPNGIVHAARLEGAALAEEHNMEPHEALLMCVRLAAGEVAYFTSKVTQLEAEQITVRLERSRTGENDYTETSNQHELNIWVRARHDAIDRLARYSKTALDAGVQERQVRLAEQFVADIAGVFDFVLSRLGVRNHPDANEVVREGLRLIEGGAQRELAA